MQFPCFELERWQSLWENQVELNISESGVKALTTAELADNPEALRKLLAQPLGYPQTNGSEELRARIAALYPGAQVENVLVTNGCAEANFLITWALVEPGDEVVFMQPNYMQIAGVASGLGAMVKPLWLREELHWAPDLDELQRLITPKTRLVAMCSPNNPTGAVLSEKAIERICAAAERVGAYVLADEVYRGAELEGDLAPTFWGQYERVVCTGGLAKAYGLPGLRIGWVVAPAEWAERLWGYHDYTTISPTMLSDRLAALALEPARHAWLRQRTRKILKQNYPLISDWVARHSDLLTHIPPVAGAIAWLGSRGDWDSVQFVQELRKRKSVLLVPGEQFGMESYLRIGFGGDADQLQQALKRVDELLAEVGTSASKK